MTPYSKCPLKMTDRDTQTIIGTDIPKFTSFRVLSNKPDGWSVCFFEGTISACVVPTKHLREPYKERYPVADDEDPLESVEFHERLLAYRRADEKLHPAIETANARQQIKEFIQFHYRRKRGS